MLQQTLFEHFQWGIKLSSPPALPILLIFTVPSFIKQAEASPQTVPSSSTLPLSPLPLPRRIDYNSSWVKRIENGITEQRLAKFFSQGVVVLLVLGADPLVLTTGQAAAAELHGSSALSFSVSLSSSRLSEDRPMLASTHDAPPCNSDLQTGSPQACMMILLP